MATILGRSAARLFAEIKGAHPYPADTARPGDVPYHLGDRAMVDTGAGMLDVTVLANPSHLEAVDPVVLGRARALQDGLGAARVLPIILHTDAAVIGQGVVAETLQLGGTAGFSTGGTVHYRHQQPIGLHHRTERGPHLHLLHRRLEGDRQLHPARERRRRDRGGAGGAAFGGLAAGACKRDVGDRLRLLPPQRP